MKAFFVGLAFGLTVGMFLNALPLLIDVANLTTCKWGVMWDEQGRGLPVGRCSVRLPWGKL